MVYTKKQAQSSQEDVSTSHGRGRTRKAPGPEETNPKRRRLVDSSESDSDEDIPVATRDPLSSSSSCSELESDAEFSGVEDRTENEQSEVPIRETGSKRERKRNSTEKKKTRVPFTKERHQILLAAFQEDHYPKKEQREKLAEKTELTMRQINSWFTTKRMQNPSLIKHRNFTKEQSSKLKEAFAVNRNPDRATIVSLASELQLEQDQVRKYFRRSRYENPVVSTLPTPPSDKEAETLLMEVFQRNPEFRDYKNIELRNKTQWSIQRIKKFFDNCRKESGITIGPKICNQLLQRKLEQQQKLEKIFQEQQFIAITNDPLEVKTGCSWNQLAAWLRNKRRKVLKSYLKEEIPVLPPDMVKFERLYHKYNSPMGSAAVDSIAQKEKVSGFNFAEYLMDRQIVQTKLWKERGGVYVQREDGELADGQGAHEEDHNEVVYQMDAGQSSQPVDHQEEEDHVENRAVEEDNDEERLVVQQVTNGEDHQMNEEQIGQPAVCSDDVELEFQELHWQVDEPVGNQIAPVNVKVEVPEAENKNFGHLENPVKQEEEEEGDVDEDEEVELVVFDVIDRDASQDVGAVGPVVIERVQATFEDLQPYRRDIVGYPEIGFTRKSEMMENKRRLRLENYILPFNCSTDYMQWSNDQIQEFFCQLFDPATTKKLVKKVRVVFFFTIFQPDQEKLFEKKLKSIINWDQFLMICQEIQKLKDFNNKLVA
ncbi:unnamed protein product [Caenorhabditis nigoni]